MKDLKISKELLSEVLKLEVVKHSLFNKSNNSFNITYMQSEDSLKSSWMPINIFEFAFKCKEWAFSKDYKLLSLEKECFLYDIWDVLPNEWSEHFKADTEIEAIIKACTYILNNLSNKYE